MVRLRPPGAKAPLGHTTLGDGAPVSRTSSPNRGPASPPISGLTTRDSNTSTHQRAPNSSQPLPTPPLFRGDTPVTFSSTRTGLGPYEETGWGSGKGLKLWAGHLLQGLTLEMGTSTPRQALVPPGGNTTPQPMFTT